ncbi:MAG: acyltransferase [Prevotellaceae bacterium]|jgi:peptidoglycan/LPS O-acetylase OafA/YrhL|nr:acyltransferase [Prevotellaceae bacterium]
MNEFLNERIDVSRKQGSNIFQAIPSANNFDFLRLLLAFSVMCNHYSGLTGQNWYLPISSAMAVHGFFVISGFLIMRSFYRSHSLKDYFQKRARRIMPAYILVVLLCAFGLVFLSDLLAGQYFSSPVFFKYLAANLSFLNFIQPSLPGVFTENPEMTAVNGSLWTIKIELLLYLSVPFIAWLLRRWDKRIVLGGIYLFSIIFNRSMDYLYLTTGNEIYEMLARQVFFQLSFFISGAFLLFYFKIFFKYRFALFLIALPAVLFRSNDFVFFLYPMALGIVIFTIAFSLPFLNKAGKYGDISYGIYLFHFPVIQLFISLNLFNNNNFIAFLPVVFSTLLLAWLSWHLVEKRFLERKNK